MVGSRDVIDWNQWHADFTNDGWNIALDTSWHACCIHAGFPCLSPPSNDILTVFPCIPDYLSGCEGDVRWSLSLYPDLYTPSSPSWSLHWTYRDSQLVNLPVSLLVEGDIIALRPGQEAFVSLRGIKVSRYSYTTDMHTLVFFDYTEYKGVKLFL